MATFEEELAAAQARIARDYGSRSSTGGGIMNELVKSYGFRKEADGRWGWSTDTIVQSFKDDPIWSTLDWAALVAGPLKMATSTVAVARGVGAAGKGLKGLKEARAMSGYAAAAEPLARAGAPKTLLGKAARAFVGPEHARAAELYKEGPSRLVTTIRGKTWGVSNPLTTKMDSDYVALADKYGAEFYEKVAIKKSAQLELIKGETLAKRIAGDTIREWKWAGLSAPAMAKGFRFLEEGVDPSSPIVRSTLGIKGETAYRNTWKFRNDIHEAAFDTGMISKRTYDDNLLTYAPRIYEELEIAAREAENLAAAGRPGLRKAAQPGSIPGAHARFAERKFEFAEDSGLTQVLDPAMALNQLGRVGQLIAHQRYAQGLSQSIIAQSADDVASTVAKILKTGPAGVRLAAIHGINAAQVKHYRRMVDAWESAGKPTPAAEAIARKLGWTKIDDMYQGGKLPKYVESLPKEFRNRWLDPAVAEDIQGTLKFLGGDDGNFTRFYNNSMLMFRASKTAYNVATHVRNAFGAAVMHHLAVGGVPRMVPLQGMKAFFKRTKWHERGRLYGHVGSTSDWEVREMIERGARGRLSDKGRQNLGQASALDWMGDSTVANIAQRGASFMERFYRGIDEVYKLDAFITLTERHMGKGLEREAAERLATHEINKFMPNFMMHSDVGDVLRKHIPFASFTTEALRIWKNTIVDKPHLAFFWNHVTESMSQSFAAMSGFSPEQLEEAQAALPHYMQGKKMVMLPFNVDGQPQFVDLSYLIPMANIVEMQDSEKTFFGQEVMDLATNPFLSVIIAAGAGVDPFSGRKIDPRFTERQLGIPVTQGRRLVGLGEHMARTMLPPIMPPGYAGVNLLEMARGQKNPATGEALEEGVFRTIMQNLGGMRAYEPDVESQILNLKKEQRATSVQVTQAWDRWKFAQVNGDIAGMKAEQVRIITLKAGEGHEDPEGYFAEGIERHGAFSSMSTKNLKEVLARAEKLGALSPRNERIRAELLAKLQARSGGRKARTARKPRKRRQ